MEAPAGLVNVEYKMQNEKCKSVKLTNVPAYLDQEGITAECPELGELVIDVSYGGNFYAMLMFRKILKDLNIIS
jgi:4-hydroxyproline epimerase